MTLDHANGSPVLEDDSPPPSLLSPPPTSLFGFGSLPETEEELLSQLDGPGSDSGTEWQSDELLDDSDPSSDPTSSPGSSRAEKPAALLSQAQMRATARQAVVIGTGMAHSVGAQKAVGLYLADDADAANIGNPLADIMHRRGDIVGGKLSPDANDFLKSLMGVAGYITKQIQKIAVVRQVEAPAQQPADPTYSDAA
jgi:hypothetical protein